MESSSSSSSSSSLAAAMARWMRQNRDWVATAASVASLATWVLPEKWTGEDLLSEGVSSLLGVISLAAEPDANENKRSKESQDSSSSPKAQASQRVHQKRRKALEFLVSVLKEIEVFAEVLASKLFPRNSLRIVGLIELCKFACRLGLLYYGNGRTLIEGCQPSSPFFPAKLSLQTLTLPTSQPDKPSTEAESKSIQQTKKILQGWRLLVISETLYHFRPIIYVLALSLLGGKESWQPWMLSASLEVATLALRRQGQHMLRRVRCPLLTKEDRSELRRRKMTCLLYLMRQPALNRITYPVASKVIKLFSKVPLLGMAANFGESVLVDMGSRYFYTSCS